MEITEASDRPRHPTSYNQSPPPPLPHAAAEVLSFSTYRPRFGLVEYVALVYLLFSILFLYID